MSIIEDPAARRRVERVRQSVSIVPFFGFFVIFVGIVIMSAAGWYCSDKFTQFVVDTDSSHAAAVKVGMIVGTIFGGGMVSGFVSLCYGVWLFFHRHADRLFLRVWDQLAESGMDN